MPTKKAQNSNAERSRIHGEIEVLKFQILHTSYLGEIFYSSTRPFFTLVGFSFCPLQI